MADLDDDYDRRAKVAAQRGDLIKLDKEFIKLVNIVRKDYNIPKTLGFKNRPGSIATWKNTEINDKVRQQKWAEAIKSLRDYLHKPPGWHKHLETYLLTDYLSAPIFSFIISENFDLITGITEMSFVQVDEPPKREDIERLLWALDVPNGYKRKSVLKARVYKREDFRLNARILHLTEYYPNNDEAIAERINAEFNKEYSDIEINNKRRLFLKRIERERLF